MMLGQQWFVTAYDYGVVDDYEKALDVYTELLAIADETSENEGVVASRLIARFRTAEITHIQGNSQIETLKEVIADSEKRLGKKHPFTISFLNHFAQSLTWSKDFELAKKYSEISYQRCRKKFGDKSPRTLEALDALIIACGRTINSPNSKDRLQNILPLAEELCEEIIQREGFVNSAIGIRFGNIATGWGLTGDIKRCIEIKRKILDAATHSNGRNHSVAQIQVMGLAVSLCAAGQLIEAEELLHEFIAYVEDRSDSDQEPWRSRLQNAKQQLMLIKIQKTIPDEKEKLRNR